MESGDFRGTTFKGARLNHANLKNADFTPLMFGNSLAEKRFSPSDFEGASLSYADFSGCKLKSANFKNADLTYTNFTGADLRDVDFTGARIDNVIFDDARMDDVKMKPDGPIFKMKTDGEQNTEE